MKKKLLLYVVCCFTLLSLSQNTNVPDINFEQALINLGYDTGLPDGLVPTSNINTVDMLEIPNKNISSLAGIEDFSALSYLDCSNNQLTTLDVSENNDLNLLYCGLNQLTSLDVRQNVLLENFWCNSNNLESLNIKNGNNTIMVDFVALNNPNLTCIEVDDASYSNGMWFNIDPQTSFSENCPALSIN